VAVLVTAMLVAGCATASTAPSDGGAPGAASLPRCQDVGSAFCGTVTVPLNRAHPALGTISVGYEWYPATGRSEGTVLGIDGGPGYSTTSARQQYLTLLGPVRDHRNLLLVDLRGTGRSSPLDCPNLQHYRSDQPRSVYLDAVASCGAQLGDASDAYTTSAGVADVIAVLDQLRVAKVDYYGLSYGTWFGQVLAARHPDRLSSLTLDSAYPVVGLDPMFLGNLAATGPAFDRVCQRSTACRDSGTHGWADIVALIDRLRTRPLQGVTADAVISLIGSLDDKAAYHDLAAAARAAVEHSDPVPLQRLIDDSGGSDDSGKIRDFSSGMFHAVVCTDYPHPFDIRAEPAVRARQLADATARIAASATAPLTPAEWVYSDPGPLDALTIDACLRWPHPRNDPAPPMSAPPTPATVPALVLSGDLDTNTAPGDGANTLASLALTPRRLVTVPNTTHVTAMSDTGTCAADIVRAFIRAPATLGTLDTSCTDRVPEVRAVGIYPREMAAAIPATQAPGSSADPDDLRLGAVAVATAGDALYQYQHGDGTEGTGLRGGTWKVAGGADAQANIALSNAEWVSDVQVSGTVTLMSTTSAATADLTVNAPDGQLWRFSARWDSSGPAALATVTGTHGDHRVDATVPAP
jgi:pimeloyl-ACP methyl ester carboxylesterase